MEADPNDAEFSGPEEKAGQRRKQRDYRKTVVVRVFLLLWPELCKPSDVVLWHKPSRSHHGQHSLWVWSLIAELFKETGILPPSPSLTHSANSVFQENREPKENQDELAAEHQQKWLFLVLFPWSLFLPHGPGSQHPCSSVLQPQEMGISQLNLLPLRIVNSGTRMCFVVVYSWT